MKSLTGCLIIVCLALFGMSTAHAAEKVAVLDFKSIMAPPDLGVAVAEILRTELIGVGDYTVIERGMLEELLKEQELQLTGAVDSETAVEIGKLAGANLVVIGSIVKTGVVYTINSRFIDVETGVAKVGQNIRGQGEDQISDMVHQLALVIAGKTVTEEPLPRTVAAPPAPTEAPELLFSFETDRETGQWTPFAEPVNAIERVSKHATDGQHALRFTFPKHVEWPEIDTTYCPNDWSSAQVFAFDLYYETQGKENEPFSMGVRIDDSGSTPQNQRWFADGFLIFPGANTIRIPVRQIGEKVNLADIKRVMLFTDTLKKEKTVYLDHVRFEREGAAQP